MPFFYAETTVDEKRHSIYFYRQYPQNYQLRQEQKSRILLAIFYNHYAMTNL